MNSKSAIYERLESVIETLSPKMAEQVADYAEYLKSREEWDATQELLNDPEMRSAVDEGRRQAEKKQGRSWREVKKSVVLEEYDANQ